MTKLRVIAFTIAVMVAATINAFASSHGSAKVETASGIPLGALLHEQVGPIYQHYGEILARAKAMAENPAVFGTNRDTFLEVLNFTEQTFTKAQPYDNVLGNLVTGDILTSDANPGHLPTHAYLRGAYDLLLRMNQADSLNPGVEDLYNRVNLAMENMMGLCAYSSTIFATTDVVKPDWSSRTTLRASIPAGGLVLLIAALNLLAVRRRRSSPYMVGLFLHPAT